MPKDAIFPGHMASVVRRAPDGQCELVELSRGFVLPHPSKAPRRVTNTRDDKMGSLFWGDSLVKHRCLLPMTSFYELGRREAGRHGIGSNPPVTSPVPCLPSPA